MRILFAAAASSVQVLLLVGVVVGWECADGVGYWCAGPSMVQQCVDGQPMGVPVDCGGGFVCDSANQWGPCVPQPQDACCGEGLFPVKGNCRLFLSCINDGARLVQFFGSCATGFAFNPLKLKCQRATDPLSLCLFNDQFPETTTIPNATEPTYPSTVITTTTTPTTTTTTPTTTTTTPTTTTTVPLTTKAKPVCNSPGHYPDPSSCRHYYFCSWASGGGVKAVRTRCVQNLVFDTTMRQCVYSTSCGTRPR